MLPMFTMSFSTDSDCANFALPHLDVIVGLVLTSRLETDVPGQSHEAQTDKSDRNRTDNRRKYLFRRMYVCRANTD